MTRTETRNDPLISPSPRREAFARRAFYVWMTAYAAVIVAIATVYSMGGPAAVRLDAERLGIERASATGAPQSSIAGRDLPGATLVDERG